MAGIKRASRSRRTKRIAGYVRIHWLPKGWKTDAKSEHAFHSGTGEELETFHQAMTDALRSHPENINGKLVHEFKESFIQALINHIRLPGIPE